MTTPDSTRVVVTGGCSGFGAATVRLAVEHGARAVAIDLADRDGIHDGDRIRFVRADVSEADDIARGVNAAAELLSGIDALFVNAGINGMQAPIGDLTPDEWRTTLGVCLDGAFFTLRAAVPHLVDGAAVVFMSSITGTRSFATEGAAAYAAAKAGATALAQLAAVELGPRGIRVNVVAPGGVLDTRLLAERTQVRNLEQLGHERRIDPALSGAPTSSRDIAELVWFLMSGESRRISGAVVHIDGAQSLLGGGIVKPPGAPPLTMTMVESEQ